MKLSIEEYLTTTNNIRDIIADLPTEKVNTIMEIFITESYDKDEEEDPFGDVSLMHSQSMSIEHYNSYSYSSSESNTDSNSNNIIKFPTVYEFENDIKKIEKITNKTTASKLKDILYQIHSIEKNPRVSTTIMAVLLSHVISGGFSEMGKDIYEGSKEGFSETITYFNSSFEKSEVVDSVDSNLFIEESLDKSNNI
ncbi:hypothetical protein [Macrococcoides canis]|uniref:hypothetical protein n=1 Tax=Macrococcoides canis TaxID=1855823 RepID=UPI0022B92AEC|nr:hypothetical protein [Macrococcus canis]WBF53826.1 hypothetical protein LL975_05910 [Macrococcus canis]